MGLSFNIYGFSIHRDKKTIEKFLHQYTYRTEVEDWKDCDLSIYENDTYEIQEQYVSIRTLTEAIEYGLEHKNHGFAFYIGSKGVKGDISHVILKFTYDSAIIFGLSITEYAQDGQANYKRAYELEQELKAFLPVQKTSIQFEYPPSDDKEEFEESIEVWKEMNRTELQQLRISTALR